MKVERVENSDDILQQVIDNQGYCPCRIQKTPDTKCMCKEFREQIKRGEEGDCHCGLYTAVKEERSDGMYMQSNSLMFAKTDPNAKIPTKRDEDAGYDIYACIPEGEYILIPPHCTIGVHTGIACAVSSEYYLQVQERGSTGIVGLKYGAGVIDSGYRGEIQIVLTNTTNHNFYIADPKNIDDMPVCIKDNIGSENFYPLNKAIAQLVVLPVPKMLVQEITYDELLQIPSERGTGRLGSSNK